MLANRLGAYTGVMQARNLKRQQDERGDAPSGERPSVVSDTVALESLASTGWVERG